MYVLVINLRVPPMNLCIGVGTRFRRDSPIETLGSPCSSLCGLNIMIMKLFDAYDSINSWILVVTMEYLGDIRVLVDLCLKVLF